MGNTFFQIRKNNSKIKMTRYAEEGSGIGSNKGQKLKKCSLLIQNPF